ncbi:UDP-glucose 4-epimerase GalE [Neptunicoccus sediminis]|uniref:UDP-glucose 4-epimerase GalE n=1 Tax=Neptunicoccus sediminis TaxID=1892596 RepID=UPI000845F9BF|nr:UDP-glucose 4-epimerase GalE [Neptunicoccus sediminis]
MTQKILLTGGAGYIGAHTFVALHEAGYHPVILDNFANADQDTPARLAQLTGRKVDCHDCDLMDKAALDAVFEKHDFEAVIHFAALKAVGESVAKPQMYFDNNTGGLINLMGSMEKHDVKRIVFSSSATVYGDAEEQPIPETAPLGATNPYGLTKLMGEMMLGQMQVAHPDWTIGILRYFNPAGVHPSGLLYQSPKSGNNPPENLMPRLLEVAVGTRPHLMVFGNDYDTPDGTGVRDYIHITDLCRGHVLSLDALIRTNESHTVNLGTGTGYSVLDMIREFAKACGREVPYEMADRRPGDVGTCYADVTLAREVLEFEAELGLAEMCIDSWRESGQADPTS